MSAHHHRVTAREIGQVRIYMTPAERPGGRGVRGLFAKPLYQQVIDLAPADGILNAVAHPAHYGATAGPAAACRRTTASCPTPSCRCASS